jgi:hypothetical protein
MRARSVWLAGITAVGVLLGGCANEDAPATLPEVDEPTKATGSASPGSSSTQESGEGDLTAELEQFLARYIAACNRSWSSRDALNERRTYFADSCESCYRGWQMALNTLEDGHSLEGEPVSAVLIAIDDVHDHIVTLRTQIESPAAVIKGADGAVVQELDSTRTTTVYRLSRQSSGRWIIIDDEVLGS